MLAFAVQTMLPPVSAAYACVHLCKKEAVKGGHLP